MTKRVSFKVARVLKDAGYPQDITDSHYTNWGELVCYGIAGEDGFDIPTYLEAWLWLCDHLNYIDKRKLQSIRIFKGRNKWEIRFDCGCLLDSDDDDGCYYEFIGNTQEEVIEKAIDYLVDNELIK